MGGGLPDAETAKVAVSPLVIVWLSGWLVMVGPSEAAEEYPSQVGVVKPVDPFEKYMVKPVALPSNTVVPIDGASPRKMALVIAEQSSNALLPMLVTPAGMVMLVRVVQPWKELVLILVTPPGMAISTREEQELKA